ncbi:MAG: hypothetical protein H6830_12920 [Planctomycetes bacterium]|nr:hypothetical protein [Planctomycetota bacterium]MCB9912897.1 hypothetical protein [Planctomycetota bacterium]HPF13646.1 hypothetical protein [Planctomycetota bacterium]HRV80170.1 hypothetical protein [Planctomycetota bacterium]
MKPIHRLLLPLAAILASAPALAGDIRVTFTGTVNSIDAFGGIPFAVAIGDPLVLSFEVDTPGIEVFPLIRTDYPVDPATLSIETQVPTGLQLLSPFPFFVQDDAGTQPFDGFGVFQFPLTGQVSLNFSFGMDASFFAGHQLYQNLGTHPLGTGVQWGSYSLSGPGWLIGATGFELRIEAVPLTDAFCDPAQPNSTGFATQLTGARLDTPGSGLHLEALQGPPTQFGYVLVGDAVQTPGVVLDQGLLCLATGPGRSLGRYNQAGNDRNSLGQFDAQGVLQNFVGTSALGSGFDVPGTLPFAGAPMLQAGQTWHFQLWYRDGASHSNLSNGLSVTF